MLNIKNREILMADGLFVYRKATPNILTQRLRDEEHGSPLLHGDGELVERIASLLNERSESFDMAHRSINSDYLTPEHVGAALFRRMAEDISD